MAGVAHVLSIARIVEVVRAALQLLAEGCGLLVVGRYFSDFAGAHRVLAGARHGLVTAEGIFSLVEVFLFEPLLVLALASPALEKLHQGHHRSAPAMS